MAALLHPELELAILLSSVEALGMSPLSVHFLNCPDQGHCGVRGWHGRLSLLAIAAYEQIPSVPVLLGSSTFKGFADVVRRVLFNCFL